MTDGERGFSNDDHESAKGAQATLQLGGLMILTRHREAAGFRGRRLPVGVANIKGGLGSTVDY